MAGSFFGYIEVLRWKTHILGGLRSYVGVVNVIAIPAVLGAEVLKQVMENISCASLIISLLANGVGVGGGILRA